MVKAGVEKKVKINFAIYCDQGEMGQGDDPNGWRNGIKNCIDMLNKPTCIKPIDTSKTYLLFQTFFMLFAL
jgi:hypothetical protein